MLPDPFFAAALNGKSLPSASAGAVLGCSEALYKASARRLGASRPPRCELLSGGLASLHGPPGSCRSSKIICSPVPAPPADSVAAARRRMAW